MKNIIRLLTLLLALTVVLGLTVSVSAAETTASGTFGGNLTWTLDSDGTLTISGTGAMPDYVDGVPWQDHCELIRSVVIEAGVTNISDYTFHNLDNLTSVTIADSVSYIGAWAFYGCSSLTGISIPEGVPGIGYRTFYGCSSLSSVTIPGSVTRIDDYAFYNCSSLAGITIPDSVTGIGSYAFAGCGSLTSITISGGVTEIGESAFYDCSSLVIVTITGSVTGIGDSVFEDCSSLTSITIPESVTSIGNYAFYGCSSLENVIIPDGVTSIGHVAFYNCSSLTGISIPGSVTSIGSSAFSNCSNLEGIWVDQNNQYYSSDDRGVLFNKDKTTLCAAPGAISGAYAVPGSVTSIGYDAFSRCSGLTSVTIPDSVTDIGYRAFSYCGSLAEITFKGNAPGIGFGVFENVIAAAYFPANNETWADGVRQDYWGSITWVAYSKDVMPNKIVNVVSGVHVYWQADDGAAKYGLWRSETGKNGTYKWIANPTVPHFTDTKVVSGKTYYYKVTAVNASGEHSEKSLAIGISFVGTPDITSRFNKAAGITLGWNKIEGATGYAIYRKSYSGNDAWARVATISGNNTFTWQDTSVKNNNGTVYKYTVRALAGSNMKTLSGCRNTGRTMARLASRTLNSVQIAGNDAIKCSWTTSSAVTGYEIRFMVGNQVYKTFTVGNYKTGVKTFTGLEPGQTYKIQVRSYLKVDGMGFYSAWSTEKTVTLE